MHARWPLAPWLGSIFSRLRTIYRKLLIAAARPSRAGRKLVCQFKLFAACLTLPLALPLAIFCFVHRVVLSSVQSFPFFCRVVVPWRLSYPHLYESMPARTLRSLLFFNTIYPPLPFLFPNLLFVLFSHACACIA